MSAIVRFSAAVAFSADRRQRWRQFCLIGSAALAAFLILLSCALGLLSVTSPVRAGSLLGVPTTAQAEGVPGLSPDGAVAAVVERGTLAMGRQVPTVWIEPMLGHEDDPAAVPRGLTTLPDPGEAVLSPALVSAGYTAEDLGWLSSDAGSGSGGAIGYEGLAAASEPLIFVRPAPGATLGEGGAITYIATFTESDPNAVYGGYSYDPEVISSSMMIPGVLMYLIAPSIALLISSSRARSLVRDERLRFLHLLGASSFRARAAMALETALLGIVGSLIGALVYAVSSRWLTVIPATSVRLLPGDLVLPWWAYSLPVAAVTGCAAVCGALGRIRLRRNGGRARAGHRIAVAALVLSVVCVMTAATPWVSSSYGSTVLFSGTIGMLIALPLAVPAITAGVARSMSGTKSPVLWAAARRLRHDSVHLSRIASIMGMLIIVVSVAISLWASAAATQAEGSAPSETQVLAVGWRGNPDSGLSAARRAFADVHRDVLIVPVLSQDDSKGPLPRLLDIDDCNSFTAFFGGDASVLCTPGRSTALSDFAKQNTGMRIPDSSARLLPSGGLGEDVMIYSKAPLAVEDVQRTLGFLPALNIALPAHSTTAPLPLVQWLIAGALAAFLILGMAIAREIGDRNVEDADRDLLYQRLGLSWRTADRLSWMVLLIPLLVSAATAFVCSLVIAYAGEVLQIARGDTVKLLAVAAVSLALPVSAVLVSIPARRATTAAVRQ